MAVFLRGRGKLNEEMNLFLRYGSAYFLVFLLFLLLFLPIYGKVLDMARISVLEESARKLHEGVLLVDNQFDKMIQLANVIQDNEKYIQLSRVTGEPLAKDYYAIRKLEEELMNVSNYQTVPMKFFLLFHKNPIMVSPGVATARYGDFYGKALLYEGMSNEEFYEAFFDMDSRTKLMRDSKIRYLDGREYSGATFLVKIPVQGFGNFHGVMAFVLEKEGLFQMFVPEDIAEDTFLFVMNKYDDTPLIQAGCIQDIDQEELSLLAEGKISNGEYTVISEDTQESNLKIVIGIRKKVFSRNVSAVTNLINWYAGIALVLFLAGSIWFALRRVKSVGELIKVLHFAGDNRWKAGDYRFIRQAFMDINRKTDRYEKEIKEMKAILDNTVLEKMFLYGVYSQKEKKEVESLLGQSVEFYCVVSVNWDLEDKDTQEKIAASRSIMYQMNRYLEEYYKSNIVSVSSGMRENIFLIPLKPSEDSYTRKIGVIFRQMGQFLQEEFGACIYCGISDISMDIYNVHLSYLQAKTAARQNAGEELVNEYDAVKNSCYTIDFHLGAQLYELIVSGELQGIGLLFDKLERQLKYEKLESEEDIKHLFYMLRDAISHGDKELQAGSGCTLPSYSMDDNVWSLLKSLRETAEALGSSYLEKKKSKNPELKKRILKYIETNFQDPDLGAAEVSQGCGISEKYLYQFVKEQTGRTVGDYIEGLRMEECKRLMLETDKSINEICILSGFRSVNTFYKAFKRLYGVAPGKWRESRNFQ